MNAATALESDADDTVTVTGFLSWLGDEEWTEERAGQRGGIIPAQPKRRIGIADGIGRDFPVIFGTLYYREGDEVPPKGARVSAHGKIYVGSKNGTRGLSIGGAKGYLRYADEAEAERVHRPQPPAAAPGGDSAGRSGPPPAHGQASPPARPTGAPGGQQVPAGPPGRPEPIPLEVNIKLLVSIYRQLDQRFKELGDTLNVVPSAPELEAMAVSCLISVHKREVSIPAATMAALLGRQAPATPAAGAPAPTQGKPTQAIKYPDPYWVREPGEEPEGGGDGEPPY
jgi:hypothetical protein